MEEHSTSDVQTPRLSCLSGESKPEPSIDLPPGMSFTATDRLEFLRVSQQLRQASLKPGLSSPGRLALRFLSQQTRRLAGPGRG